MGQSVDAFISFALHLDNGWLKERNSGNIFKSQEYIYPIKTQQDIIYEHFVSLLKNNKSTK